MNPVKNESDERINISQGKETSIIVILQENMTFLQNKLSSKNEIGNGNRVVCFSDNAK